MIIGFGKVAGSFLVLSSIVVFLNSLHLCSLFECIFQFIGKSCFCPVTQMPNGIFLSSLVVLLDIAECSRPCCLCLSEHIMEQYLGEQYEYRLLGVKFCKFELSNSLTDLLLFNCGFLGVESGDASPSYTCIMFLISNLSIFSCVLNILLDVFLDFGLRKLNIPLGFLNLCVILLTELDLCKMLEGTGLPSREVTVCVIL